jgi:hypothetical protein
MTEVTRATLANELGSWPAIAKGWTWTWQRCGRYGYRKCLVHMTNPDQLAPNAPVLTSGPSLRIAGPYAAGRLRAPRHAGPDGE